MTRKNNCMAKLIIFALAICMFTVAPAMASDYTDTVDANNPIAWWRMDDASDSAGSHNGTAGSGVNFAQPGGITDPSLAATFDGTSESVILVADAADLNFGKTTDFSIEAWAKRPSGLTNSFTTIVNKGDTNGSYWLRYESDGTVKMNLDYGTTSTTVQSPLAYDDGQLHHFVGTADRNGSLTLYIDGQAVAETLVELELNGGNVNSSEGLSIGQFPGSAYPFSGLMDEVAVYGQTLTAQQIQNHYDAAMGTSGNAYDTVVGADSPTGWWRMANAQDETATQNSSVGGGVTFGQTSPISGDTTGAASFDGSSEGVILVQDSETMNFGTDGDFAVEAWVNMADTGLKAIINEGDTHGGYWMRFESDGTIRFLLDYDTSSNAVRSADPYTDGQWHHVVGVADRDSSLQLYIDGQLVAQEDLLMSDVSSTGMDLEIGQLTTNHPMNGLLDEVAIYDTVLSAADVLAHYEAGAVEPLPGDANGDGIVNDLDAAALADNWQTATEATWAMGDFNNDGAVDDIDATILASNWQTAAASQSVPEPSSMIGLLGLCLAGFLASARRK